MSNPGDVVGEPADNISGEQDLGCLSHAPVPGAPGFEAALIFLLCLTGGP